VTGMEQAPRRRIVLLGPQHPQPANAEGQAALILRELGVKGPVALVTAGWQEREGDPGVIAALGVEAIELRLGARANEVFARDREFAAAYKTRQTRLKRMQEFYRVRLDHAAQSAKAIGVRSADPDLLAEEHAVSLELIRQIDRDHLARCRATHAAFDASWAARPEVARHVDELRAAIEPTDALVIAGGHVAVILNRLRLFGVLALAGHRPIVAWSAGAMALTERVVLFHDDPPHGIAISEVLDAGLGEIPDLVVLPEPRLRLRLDARDRVAEFAQRYAPATCLAMDHDARLWIDGSTIVREVAQRLDPSGRVEAFE
jgi:hypothetical protein